MHRRWKDDPSSVHSSWDVYFSGLDKGLPSESAYQAPPSLMTYEAAPVHTGEAGPENSVDDHLKLQLLVRA